MKKVVAAAIIIASIFLAGYLYDQVSTGDRIPVTTITKVEEGQHRLMVDGKHYLIKGVCYAPIPVGKDYEYNYWGDPAKPWLVDGKMMKAMGANTVRFYRPGKNPAQVNKVLDDLYKKFGIRVLMGHYLGFWDWPPPNYTDKEFTDKVRSQVLEMVKLYKDNPAILMWVLGNENNYSFDQNIQRWSNDELDAMSPQRQRIEKAKIYYSFVNKLAADIKKIDPRHPVVMGVGEVASLEIAKTQCPNIDAIGMIAYRGPGFGNLFRQVQQKFDVPMILTEWGADSYNAYTREPDESSQADFVKLQWQDIERNSDPKKGVGNCLGGVIFEWSDEWWKSNENLPTTWTIHDSAAGWMNASYHFDAQSTTKTNMNEEWFGIVSLSPKKIHGLNERIPKKSYGILKSLWTEKS